MFTKRVGFPTLQVIASFDSFKNQRDRQSEKIISNLRPFLHQVYLFLNEVIWSATEISQLNEKK